MRLLIAIWHEGIGLFVDDGALAALCVALIAIVAALVVWLGLPQAVAGVALLAGCIGILAWSVLRAAQRR